MICTLSRVILTALLLSSPLLALGATQELISGNYAEVSVQNIRIGLTPGRTRVVFDLSSPANYQLTTLEAPERVLMRIDSSKSDIDTSQLDLRGSFIKRFTGAPQPDGDFLYSLELREPTSARVFALKALDNHGPRLVLDLSAQSHSNSPDPAAITASAADTTARKQGRARRNSAPGKQFTGEWSGYISAEAFLFFEDPAYNKQEKYDLSAALKPEYYAEWADGRQQFSFSPFFRYDYKDDERTHADIRELYWRIEQGPWTVKAGLDIVFWGVIEAQHLVDIINQTDLVEDIDGEEKLGQPMLNLDYMSDWGSWQFYLLPYFRERTFPGERGRPRTNPVVDTNHPVYESGSEEKHVDFALRWSHYVGDWDIGVAHFSGTGREPLLVPSQPGRKPALVPYYIQIEQTSLDLQATKGAWLWKLEALYNSNDINNYYAYAGGFEYTQYTVAGSAADLGWLLEYHYDERSGDYTTTLQKDVYAGLRYTGNDIAGTMLLAGVVYDTKNQSTFFNLEASRRLSEAWTLSLDLRLFANIDDDDLLYQVKDDSYLQVRLKRYF